MTDKKSHGSGKAPTQKGGGSAKINHYPATSRGGVKNTCDTIKPPAKPPKPK